MAKEVRIIVKAVRRKEPDLRKLARALIQQVLEEQQSAKAASTVKDDPPKEAAS